MGTLVAILAAVVTAGLFFKLLMYFLFFDTRGRRYVDDEAEKEFRYHNR